MSIARGIVLGQQDLDVALVRLASAEETARVVAARDVVLAGVADGTAGDAPPGAAVFIELDGRLRRLGSLAHWSEDREMIDITSMSDSFRRFAPGQRTFRLTVLGDPA